MYSLRILPSRTVHHALRCASGIRTKYYPSIVEPHFVDTVLLMPGHVVFEDAWYRSLQPSWWDAWYVPLMKLLSTTETFAHECTGTIDLHTYTT